MTVINDTRVVRLQRTAARTGHQHSGDERIVEEVTLELVTSADVVSLPPGSLITLQRGPGAGLTEEGSVLNAARNNIGGVTGGQTTSVSFTSEDAGATAASIFVTEIDFASSLTASGQYAINYKTFQIKTYDPVPTTPGSRIQINYAWAPIREYLEFDPEDLDPDLEAFGDGPHQAGTGGVANVIAGCNINVDETDDGYSEVSLDIQSIAGDGLIVVPGDNEECPELQVDIDAYQVGYDDSDNSVIFADNVQDAITEIDGYLQGLGVGGVAHIRKFGSEADNSPFNTLFSLDGNTYPIGQDRLMVFLNGVAQFTPQDFVEYDTDTIEFTDNVDYDAIVDILILPGSLGGGNGGTTNLQGAYDNSPSSAKNINLDDGQVRITQTLSAGSALRLRTSSATNVVPTIDINHEGTAEGIRVKSVGETKSTLLVQKDTVSRGTILNSTIIERTTSHPIGALTGIGSAILTRLENSGGSLFDASKIITGTEDASDSSENSYLSFELMEDGTFSEQMRLTSTGSLGLGVINPGSTLHVQGDGYVAEELDVANKVRAGSDSELAPLNVPIFSSDPVTLENGDIWVVDDGGTRELKVRISGVTYTTTLS